MPEPLRPRRRATDIPAADDAPADAVATTGPVDGSAGDPGNTRAGTAPAGPADGSVGEPGGAPAGAASMPPAKASSCDAACPHGAPAPAEPADGSADAGPGKVPAGAPAGVRDGAAPTGGGGSLGKTGTAGPLGAATLVAVGGAFGTAARTLLDTVLPSPAVAPWLPSGVLTANLTGAFLIGLLAFLLTGMRSDGLGRHRLWPLLGTGVLGGYTTYSALALDTSAGLLSGSGTAAAHAALYGGGSVVAGVAACGLGVVLAVMIQRVFSTRRAGRRGHRPHRFSSTSHNGSRGHRADQSDRRRDPEDGRHPLSDGRHPLSRAPDPEGGHR